MITASICESQLVLQHIWAFVSGAIMKRFVGEFHCDAPQTAEKLHKSDSRQPKSIRWSPPALRIVQNLAFGRPTVCGPT